MGSRGAANTNARTVDSCPGRGVNSFDSSLGWLLQHYPLKIERAWGWEGNAPIFNGVPPQYRNNVSVFLSMVAAARGSRSAPFPEIIEPHAYTSLHCVWYRWARRGTPAQLVPPSAPIGASRGSRRGARVSGAHARRSARLSTSRRSLTRLPSPRTL